MERIALRDRCILEPMSFTHKELRAVELPDRDPPALRTEVNGGHGGH
jgi:hypothetical protein